MRKGDLIFYKNIPQFLSWLQRVVTSTIYSHVSIAMGILVYNREGEFEADLKVRLHSFAKRSGNMDVLKLEASEWAKSMALRDTIKKYEGKNYGYIQWLPIPIRYFCEWFLKVISIDNSGVKKWNILWGWGVVCSELAYYYLKAVAKYVMIEHRLMLDKWLFEKEEEARQFNLQVYWWSRLDKELDDYNPDLFTPKDIENLSELYNAIMGWEIA